MADEAWTCGKGLAQNARLPAKIAELLGALAENLALHMPALVASDANARQEYAAYDSLSTNYRDLAERLAAVAKEMEGYRDLPMGEHDRARMMDPAIREAFARYIDLKVALHALLAETLARDTKMLASMQG